MIYESDTIKPLVIQLQIQQQFKTVELLKSYTVQKPNKNKGD